MSDVEANEFVAEGTWNVRDAGAISPGATPRSTGWEGVASLARESRAEGARGTMRPGLLYRSALLARLTDDGRRVLAERNVSTVIDLRAEAERMREGTDAVGSGIQVLNLSFDPDVQAESADPEQLAQTLASGGFSREAMERHLVHAYLAFIDGRVAQASLRGAIEAVIESEGAVWFHCTAGKDRTGWLAIVLQSICGMDPAAMEHDYLLSARYADRLATWMAIPPELDLSLLEPALSVSPRYITLVLEHVRDGFGDLAQYLDKIGVSQVTRTALRAKLVA